MYDDKHLEIWQEIENHKHKISSMHVYRERFQQLLCTVDIHSEYFDVNHSLMALSY